MHYDIASKEILKHSAGLMLRLLAGLDVNDVELIDELPQEQTNVTRGDFAARFHDSQGAEGIVLIELQTRWVASKLHDLAIDPAQRMQRHDVPVVPVMVLLTPHDEATNVYVRGALRFEFHLIRLWEIDPALLLAQPEPWLWTLVPLTRGGVAMTEQVDSLLHNAKLDSTERSNLLTTFLILLALKDKAISELFHTKRRELMIESPFYQVIKDEGIAIGKASGQASGLALGRRLSLLEVLAAMTPEVPARILQRIDAENDSAQLSRWLQLAWRSRSLEAFEQQM